MPVKKHNNNDDNNDDDNNNNNNKNNNDDDDDDGDDDDDNDDDDNNKKDDEVAGFATVFYITCALQVVTLAMRFFIIPMIPRKEIRCGSVAVLCLWV